MMRSSSRISAAVVLCALSAFPQAVCATGTPFVKETVDQGCRPDKEIRAHLDTRCPVNGADLKDREVPSPEGQLGIL